MILLGLTSSQCASGTVTLKLAADVQLQAFLESQVSEIDNEVQRLAIANFTDMRPITLTTIAALDSDLLHA
jgi:hypothetical protein